MDPSACSMFSSSSPMVPAKFSSGIWSSAKPRSMIVIMPPKIIITNATAGQPEPRVLYTREHTCSAHSSGSSDSVGVQSNCSFCVFLNIFGQLSKSVWLIQSQLCMSLLGVADRRGVQHQRLSIITDALIALIRRARKRDAENPDHLSVLNRRFLIRPYIHPLHSISDIIQTTATMPQYRPIPQAVSHDHQ